MPLHVAAAYCNILTIIKLRYEIKCYERNLDGGEWKKLKLRIQWILHTNTHTYTQS